MPLAISERTVTSISIVDDEQDVRDSYVEALLDLSVVPINEQGPLPDLQEFVSAAIQRADAAVCDYKLRVRNYAPFNGAELVASFFDRGFPALLCTKWDRASIMDLRRFRSRIPVMVKHTDLDPAAIVSGLATCIDEIAGRVSSTRQTFRTLVRVEEVTTERDPSVYVVVPAWNPSEVVQLLMTDIPNRLHAKLVAEGRIYADVNLGAEAYEDLFFRTWHCE